MAKGFKTGRGAGMALNISVKRYDSLDAINAAAPRDNTICVVSDIEITEWVFSPSAPGQTAEGMLWLQTGNEGKATVNALRKNGILLTLVACCQYIGGKWVRKNAYIRKDGASVSWATEAIYLYENGDLHEDVTGGWVTSGTAPGITYNADTMVISGSEVIGSTGQAHTVNEIDLTDVNEIIFEGCSGSGVATMYAGDKSVGVPTTEGELALDVSELTGAQYIGFSFNRPTAVSAHDVVTMRSLRLE